MLASYATGILAVVAMAVFWVGVQRAWRAAFPEACTDPDALAGRPGCRSCPHPDARKCRHRKQMNRNGKGGDHE